MRAATEANQRDVGLFGEGVRLFSWLRGDEPAPDEVLFEGVTGCGKTRLLAEWVKAACTLYPESKGIIVRETRVSLNNSVLELWEKEVLGLRHPAVIGGPGRRNRYEYSHPRLGGRVVLGGYDNPLTLFSSQWDWVWFNEVQETSLEKWELLSRAMREWMADNVTGSKMPCSGIIIGDCNPDTEHHWANQRFPRQSNTLERDPGEDGGGRIRLVGRFWDNPKIYDHAQGEWTPKGRAYLRKLSKNLSGVRRRRLFEGEWVAAEGAVWADFDAQVHCVSAAVGEDPEGGYFIAPYGWKDALGKQRQIPIKWFFGSMDWGFDDPSCAQVWGVDVEGRMWMVAEVYHGSWTQEKWADIWTQLDDDFPLQSVVVDHEPALIENMNKRIGPRRGRNMKEIVRPCNKTREKGAEKVGIDQVRVRLQPREDGTRGIYFLRDSLRYGEDPGAVERGHPRSTVQEIPAYVYRIREDGKPYKEEPDPKCIDHGCDTLRYACDFAAWRNLTPKKKEREFGVATYGHALGHKDVRRGA